MTTLTEAEILTWAKWKIRAEKAQAEIVTLRAALAAARKVIEPFARFADSLNAGGYAPDALPVGTAPLAPLTADDPHPCVGDLRAARSWLAAQEPKS